MKKNGLIIFLLLLPFLCMAQESRQNNFKLGFTASPTFGWVNYSSEPLIDGYRKNSGLRTGFSYGIMGDFGFSENYFFSTALTVTTINAKVKSADALTPTSALSVNKLQYLEIPASIKLKSAERNSKLFYGQFGLSSGINIRAKQNSEITTSGGTPTEEKNKDIADAVNTFRLGLIIGGGTEWKISPGLNLQTGLSYNNGFTNVFNSSDKTRNSYLSFNLGIFF